MAGSEDDYCEMTDMLKSGCDHCKHKDVQIVERDPVHRPKAQGDIVVAEYRGTCGGCGEDILIGDHIGVIEEITNDKGEVVRKIWAHYGCCE